jgi:hypothetical protein
VLLTVSCLLSAFVEASTITRLVLALALLVLCVFADHPDYALAGDDLALYANLLYRCTDFHWLLPFSFTQGLKPRCFSSHCGMTEVMPCYKTLDILRRSELVSQTVKPVPLKLTHYSDLSDCCGGGKNLVHVYPLRGVVAGVTGRAVTRFLLGFAALEKAVKR